MQVQLLSPFGSIVTVEALTQYTSPFMQVLETHRKYGKDGFTPIEIPSGGFRYPYANREDFDFAIIGASDPFEYTDQQGEKWVAVRWRGEVFKRREWQGKKVGRNPMPDCVVYSRGARPTDPPHIREGGDGDEGTYVVLVRFIGGGKKVDVYAKKGESTNTPLNQPQSDKRYPMKPPREKIEQELKDCLLKLQKLIPGSAHNFTVQNALKKLGVKTLAEASDEMLLGSIEKLHETIATKKRSA